MPTQRILIISSGDSYEKDYAAKLYNRIKTNYSEYETLSWSEDDFKRSKTTITDVDKVIFFGNVRKIDDRAKDEKIRGKFNKFGIKYGWSGNIGVIYADASDVPRKKSKSFESFKDYCTEMNKKYSDVPIPESKKDVYNCQYSALLHEFMDGGGFKAFMAKANPDAPAFKSIVEQLPNMADYPAASNTANWETLEARDAYRIQVNNSRSHNIFRILNRINEPIAWGERSCEALGVMAFLALFEEKIIEIVDVSDEKDKDKPIYQTSDSLKPIVQLIEDAKEALGDKSRILRDSPLADVLLMTHADVAAAFIGGAAGFATSFAILFFVAKATGLFGGAALMKALAIIGGIIGGGAFAGVLVLAAPVAVLAAMFTMIVGKVKAKALRQEKESLLQRAVEMQQAILITMKVEVDAVKQRSDYLNALNELLLRAINDLQGDLKNAG